MASCRYQSVFYDAFAPQYQPELWRAEIFAILNKVMAPGGILTTYCCKGDGYKAWTRLTKQQSKIFLTHAITLS
jgi:tRNA U34 5-methylaminomethyl-2-thiouridine-forming methyltransferase MnmC